VTVAGLFDFSAPGAINGDMTYVMEDIMNVAGIDIGFGFTKATNGKDFQIFKSILGEAADIQFRISMGKGDNQPNLHVTVDDQSYFLGDFAEQQSSVKQFTLDQQQLMDEFVRVLALTALGNLTDSSAPLNIISGLPVGYYREYNQRLSKILSGSQEITLNKADGTSEVRRLNISKIRVIPQPLGSVLNLLFNEQGKIANRALTKYKVGVIDIGFRTTDFCIFDKMQYIERGSSTTDTGISKCFSVINKKLREECKVDIELFRLYNAVKNGNILIRGKEYDIAKLRNLVFANAARTIAGDAERLWADDWDMDAIILTGGGASELAEFLQPLLVGKILPMENSKDARLNNVYGYHKYAMFLWGGGASAIPEEATGG